MLSTLYSFNIFSPFLICSSSISAVLCLVAQSYSTLCDPVDCSPPGSSVHEDAPGKNTGVGCHALLQGIFPSEGLNPGLPHCRQIFYYLSHQGSPRILEWVAYPFSRGSSLPRNWTGVSCIAGGFFTSWPTREAQRFKWLTRHTHAPFVLWDAWCTGAHVCPGRVSVTTAWTPPLKQWTLHFSVRTNSFFFFSNSLLCIGV